MSDEEIPDPSVFDGPRFPGEAGRVWDLMQDKSHEERIEWMLNQNRGQVVWDFLNATVRDDDLRGAWPLVDPAGRRKWIRAWFEGNRPDLVRDGHDLDQSVEVMAADDPGHELWPHFERVTLRELAQNFPPAEFFSMGVNTRLVGPDTMLFHIHDQRVTGDSWAPGQQTRIHPVLVRWNGERWRVLDVGSEEPTEDLL